MEMDILGAWRWFDGVGVIFTPGFDNGIIIRLVQLVLDFERFEICVFLGA